MEGKCKAQIRNSRTTVSPNPLHKILVLLKVSCWILTVTQSRKTNFNDTTINTTTKNNNKNSHQGTLCPSKIQDSYVNWIISTSAKELYWGMEIKHQDLHYSWLQLLNPTPQATWILRKNRPYVNYSNHKNSINNGGSWQKFCEVYGYICDVYGGEGFMGVQLSENSPSCVY